MPDVDRRLWPHARETPSIKLVGLERDPRDFGDAKLAAKHNVGRSKPRVIGRLTLHRRLDRRWRGYFG
jgi:hypothetical protein